MSSTLRSSGFTLLELLVALALMAILGGVLYGSFFTLTKGRDSAIAGMEDRRDLRETLDLVRREIAAAIYKPDNKLHHFIVEDRDYFGKPASTLDFTTIDNPERARWSSSPTSGLIAVKYRGVAKEEKFYLARQAPDPYLTIKEPVSYPQMENLESFLVECYDGSKWVKSWDTALNKALPKMVRVTIKVKEGEQTVAFTAIAVPMIGG